MEVYAHRGLLDESGRGALENTPLALHRAVEAGFSAETDFRYGAGHDILIFQDNTLARLSHLEGEHSEDVADLRAFSAGVWFDDYHGNLLQRVSRLDLPLFYVSPELYRDTHPLGNGKQQEGWHQILGNPRFVGICTDLEGRRWRTNYAVQVQWPAAR